MKVPSLPVMDVDAGYASIWPQLTEASREALAREALHPDATCYASPGTSAELLRLTGEGLDPPRSSSPGRRAISWSGSP